MQDVDTLIAVRDEENKMEQEGAYAVRNYTCEICSDTGRVIYDWADHTGEHNQREMPCVCKFEMNIKDEIY